MELRQKRYKKDDHDEETNLEEIDEIHNTCKIDKGNMDVKFDEIIIKGTLINNKKPDQSNNEEIQLCYRLKNKKKTQLVEEVDGKMKCPICIITCKNLQLHFDRKYNCRKYIDLDHFSPNLQEYLKLKRKEQKINLGKRK